MENDTNVFVMYKMEVEDDDVVLILVLVVVVFFCLFVGSVDAGAVTAQAEDTLLAFNNVFLLSKPILRLLYYSNFGLYTLFVCFLRCDVVPVGNDGNPCYVVSIYL